MSRTKIRVAHCSWCGHRVHLNTAVKGRNGRLYCDAYCGPKQGIRGRRRRTRDEDDIRAIRRALRDPVRIPYDVVRSRVWGEGGL